MNAKSIGLAAAAAAGAIVVIAAGTAMAGPATTAGTAVAAQSAGTGDAALAAAPTTTPGTGAAGSSAPTDSGAAGPAGAGGPQGGDHTPVTADELTKLKAAVTAKDTTITVTDAVKDADGSFDVFGSKDGQPVRVEVSADLKTVTVQQGRGPGGPGGPRHEQGTPVTGDELSKVTAAVTAKDSGVTVTGVMKRSDGSYDAFGTKAGAPVRVEVSADLKTVTVQTGGPGMKGGNHTPVTGDELSKVTAAVTAKDSAVTVTSVMKDEDGSYDAFGTKAGAPVRVEVSADLKTVTVQTGGPGMKGGNHTPVTGDELAKVTAAIKAKDSAVTVTSVMKDEDGSYDAFGTKAGAPVRVEVSADLKTVTVQTGGPGMGGPREFGTPVTGDELAKVTAAIKAKDSAVTVERVSKLADGSYRAGGTKAGAHVHVDISKDLATVTVTAGGPR